MHANFTITINPLPGALIDEVCRAMAACAMATGVTVTATFNAVPLQAKPGELASALVRQYHADHNQNAVN